MFCLEIEVWKCEASFPSFSVQVYRMMMSTRSREPLPPPPGVLPPPPALLFDEKAGRDLLALAKSGAFMQQLDSLEKLCELMEREENRFREVAGDPWAIPNQRQGFNIGKILTIVKVRLG